jgi:hypothetical protein
VDSTPEDHPDRAGRLNNLGSKLVMSTFSGIAADVWAILLEIGEPNQALQYLERGRTVILGQLMDDQSDLQDLKEQYSEIARRYEMLRDKL